MSIMLHEQPRSLRSRMAKLVRVLRWEAGAIATALVMAGCGGGGRDGTASEPVSAQRNPVAAFALAQQSVIAPLSGTTPVAASGNMLVNGGFESGATGWVNWGNASVVPGQASSGTSALSVGAAAGGAGQEVAGIVPGNTYRLTAQAKVSAASETVYVGVNFIDAAGEPFTQNSVLVTSTSYTTGSLDVVAPPGAVRALVYVWKNAGTGLAFVDDFAFVLQGTAVPQVASSGNLLSNGGFDSGLTSWGIFGNLNLSSAEAAAGPFAAQVGTGAGGGGQFVGGVMPGTSYRVSALAKASVPGETGFLGVMFVDAAGNGLQAQNVVFRSTSYLSVHADVTAPPNATRAQVFIWKNAGSGSVFVDEVALTRLASDPSGPQPGPGPEAQVPKGNVTPLLLGDGYMLWEQQNPSVFRRDAIVTTTMQRYAPDGHPVGTSVSVTTPKGADFVKMVPLTGGGYAATWLTIAGVEGSGLDEVWTQAFTATGTGIGSPVSLGTLNIGAVGGGAATPQIAPLAGGGHVVLWMGQQSVGSTVLDNSVYAQRFNADGVRVGPVLQVTPGGTGFLKVTGLTSGGFLAAWGDLSGAKGGARAFSASGEPLGPAQDTGATPAVGAGPAAALAPLADGGAVLVWEVLGDSLRAQTFTAAGVPSPVQLVDSHPARATIPAVAGLPGGGYVVVWNDLPGRDVYARRYATDGTAVSPATRINLVTASTANAAVIALADGRFVVSWNASGARFARTFPAHGLSGS